MDGGGVVAIAAAEAAALSTASMASSVRAASRPPANTAAITGTTIKVRARR